MQKEVITKVTTNYKFLLDGNKTTKKFKLAEETYFVYTPFKIDNHSFEILDEQTFRFGCQRPTLSDLKSFLNFIKGGERQTETYMVNERGGKLFKKEDILEETENHYIVGSNAFKKSIVHSEKQFPIEIPNLQKRDMWGYGKSVWCYGGHPLGKEEEGVIKRLEYIIESFVNLNKAIELCKN